MSAHEGKIVEDVPVKLPRPRDRKGMEYHKHKEHLTEALRTAMGKRPESPEAERKLCLA
jgi:hypothetical protein